MVLVNKNNGNYFECSPSQYGGFSLIVKGEFSKYLYSPTMLQNILDTVEKNIFLTQNEIEGYILDQVKGEENKTVATEEKKTKINEKASLMEKLINFFKDFRYAVSPRFANTLANKIQLGTDEAKTYISNYFELCDSPYSKEITDKINSPEMGIILDGIKKLGKPSHEINRRLSIYYGPAGSGKSTLACSETPVHIVCSTTMNDDDLMRDFGFIDGKPAYTHSAMRECMENGKPILLDEINLLPEHTLNYLQGLCDNKESITFNGEEIRIKDGFRVIGTMNLTINGQNHGLNEPLVDRCFDIKYMVPSATQLAEWSF